MCVCVFACVSVSVCACVCVTLVCGVVFQWQALTFHSGPGYYVHTGAELLLVHASHPPCVWYGGNGGAFGMSVCVCASVFVCESLCE